MRRLLTIFLLLAAFPIAAETVRHQISKIEFRSRIPASVLLTQSALAENQTYTDDELDIAMARLRRLPFVFSAVYTVNGSTLVVDVADEYRIFAHVDSLLQGINSTTSGYGVMNNSAGARYALPWGGVVEGAYALEATNDSNQKGWSASYQQYGLGGTRLFADFGVVRNGSEATTSPHLTIGYPLTLRQTVAVTASRSGNTIDERFGVAGHYVNSTKFKTVEAQWFWDTTNDPLFATRGLKLGAAQGVIQQRNFLQSTLGSGALLFFNESRTNASTTHLNAARFWPIGRGAITADVDTLFQRGHIDFRDSDTTSFARAGSNVRQSTADVGFVYNFFDSFTSESRHRLEFSVGIFDLSSNTNHRKDSQNYSDVRIGYAFRKRWGSLHFVASYLHD